MLVALFLVEEVEGVLHKLEEVLHKLEEVLHKLEAALHKQEEQRPPLPELLPSKFFLPVWSLEEGLVHYSLHYSHGSIQHPKKTGSKFVKYFMYIKT